MYTRCPKCETVFHITMEQLQAHNGTVRCGRCDHIFNADQQLFSDIPESAPVKKPAAKEQKKTRAPAPNKTKTAKAKPARASKPAAAPAKPSAPAEPPNEEVEAAPAPWSAPAPERTTPVETRAPASPALLSVAPKTPRRSFSTFWILGIAVLAVTLAAQTVFFYRNQLAAHATLRPHLMQLCDLLGCRVQPPYDLGRIELIQPTNIAPHPRFANALRLRATLVNRSDKSQPHPYMQVSLTDSAGRVLARRVFSPQQYLEQPTAGDDMLPHLAIGALIDLTNPDEKTVGYQIDFLAPPSSS
jgi:predicted Zn finger-like uncharacterized protein